ncbi:efflux pump antibiotic resistance protein, putative [Talaromyces stipitatus ATCC 10500]|uniref:Efflux pump dotC n=1 Tax=Talaromyces stipitatus (strain ATCC 10500 / CBS 375.48 / QM 6759 / NRRL 1006) TaxID=441959 RepID=B8LVS3_TALSN|nr:efflux pump antibiotic resistance protein, putative [Talaromyces stipitatus ATCC 10500]EED24203.1 efflux pump antibiotic resistance protein, putative [Talaromyces stipitatus ATCC 10500]
MACWPNGKASAYGAEDCRFDPCVGHVCGNNEFEGPLYLLFTGHELFGAMECSPLTPRTPKFLTVQCSMFNSAFHNKGIINNHGKYSCGERKPLWDEHRTSITCNTNADSQPNGDQEPASRAPKLRASRIAVIMLSLGASVFVSALDMTIIATASPEIAGHFQSASGYTWIGSAYTLANTATMPTWGKISDIWGRKPLLLAGLVVFFVGSMICGLADSIGLLLAGRAIQGVGSAALNILVNICVSDLFALRDRGLYFGLLSLVWAMASGVGPVLGGVFSEKLSWRWCFYINLPIIGAVFVLLLFSLKLNTPRTPMWDGLKAIDWTGGSLVIGSTVMLLLGLDFGGVTRPWSSATVVCLLVFSVVVGALFVINEKQIAKYPVIPIELFRYRSGIGSFLLCFCHGLVFMGQGYYMPLYFQAVLGMGPIMSGVYFLPFILAITFSGALTGLFIQKTGRYMPTTYLGLALMTLGVGLLINLDEYLNWSKLITFQIVSGIGIGLNFEAPLLSLQAIVGKHNAATATSTIGFVRAIACAISIVLGSVVFQNQMVKQGPSLTAALGPSLGGLLSNGDAAANIGIVNSLPSAQQAAARHALHHALTTMWVMYVGFAGAGLIGGCLMSSHPLSREHEAVVLGLRRESDNGN